MSHRLQGSNQICSRTGIHRGAIRISGFRYMGVRRYALARKLLDVPNERNPHIEPTPRGGGIAIVVTTLAANGVLSSYGVLEGSRCLQHISPAA